MSQKAWQGLSADDQKMFREAALRSNQFMREKWRDLEERSRQQAEAAGVLVVKELDRKPFEEAMAGLYQKAQHDPAAAALIARIREVE
jgi:TRAP-type C4-dicarboxylate transport system substrate-binding protein